jgi:hypothetical protein
MEAAVNLTYRTIRIFALVVTAVLFIVVKASAQEPRSTDAEVISCSPAPCVFPPTQASPLTAGGAVDAPVASDPKNPGHLLVGSYDGNCYRYSGVLGVFASSDGGSQWTQSCFEASGFYTSDGSPRVGYDLKGQAYASGDYQHDGYHTGFIAVQRSVDGVHWSSPVKALWEGFEPYYSSLAIDNNPGSPFANSVYVSGLVNTANGQRVFASHSNDGGSTWQAVPVAPVQVYPAQGAWTSLSVGKDGTVYLAWMYCNSGPGFCGDDNGYVILTKSSDGGNSWSYPTLITTVVLNHGSLPNSNAAILDWPSIAIDNTTGPHSGTLYVAAYSWTGTFLQVRVVRSTDGGNTWSTPVDVAPGITHDQFYPWLSVSPTGLVGVMWLDRRNDPANIKYQAFAGISNDGGASFQPNVQLTQSFSNPDDVSYADYMGSTWDGANDFIAAWTDSSSGVAQDMVGGIRLK